MKKEQSSRLLSIFLAFVFSLLSFKCKMDRVPLTIPHDSQLDKVEVQVRETIKRMADEIRTMSASGGTVPMPAFINAFALSPPPDIIFFLTDGQITGFSIEALLEIMPTNKKVVINTIAFGNSASKTLLQEIANATGGQYTFVPEGRNP